MSKLPSKPDFLLDPTLAKVTVKRLLTDEQIDTLVDACDPPDAKLRDSIALEFERAALVLFSGRRVVCNRTERQAIRNQLSAAQKYAKKLSYIIAHMSPELKSGLDSKLQVAQASSYNPAALLDIKYLLDAIVDVTMPDTPGAKSEDTLAWVIDGLIHAIETRLTPLFSIYGQRENGKWFSRARQAKLIFAFLKIVEPQKCGRYNLDYISYRIKYCRPVSAEMIANP